EPGQPYVCIQPKHYRRMMQRKVNGEIDHVCRGLADRSFSRSFANLLKRASVKPRRFHDLRGTFATNMINSGMKLTETKALMRHSSVNTTEKYYVHIETQKLVAKSALICNTCYVT
ncbi:MAG: tyrosine-type recombinase/integrase, partial [Planctomycetota bacterium]